MQLLLVLFPLLAFSGLFRNALLKMEKSMEADDGVFERLLQEVENNLDSYDGLFDEVIGELEKNMEAVEDVLTMDGVDISETPCIEYEHGMEFDESLWEEDERNLQSKQNPLKPAQKPRECRSWCVHWEQDWWNKCAWEMCGGCAPCTNLEDFCRPDYLIEKEDCRKVFKKLEFIPESFNSSKANMKYSELCAMNGTYVEFKGDSLGNCNKKKCPCRSNQFCANWQVQNDVSKQGGHLRVAGLVEGHNNNNCPCEAKSCTQTFIRTEAAPAQKGDAFCFEFSAATGPSWYDIAGGLFTENKLGLKEMGSNWTVPTDSNDSNGTDTNGYFERFLQRRQFSNDELELRKERAAGPQLSEAGFGFPVEAFMMRGDAVGSEGKHMTVKSSGEHFVGFWAGSFDRSGNGKLGSIIKVKDFAHGTPPPDCSDPSIKPGDFCKMEEKDLPAFYKSDKSAKGKRANCCGDFYIFQRNKCSKGPKTPPCNIKKTVAKMREQIDDLNVKMDEMLVENEKTEKIITEANVLKTKKINYKMIDSWKEDMGKENSTRW